MVSKIISRFIKIFLLLFVLSFLGPYVPTRAYHDQGLGKSQHPEKDISVAPEPSGIILFSVGGVIVAYRCWRKRKD